MCAEFLQLFIKRKTGRLGRDFEQHAAGFAEINGMKIGAVHHRRYVVAKIDEMLTPLELFGVVLCAKGNMMHRTRSDSADRRVGLTKQVNNSARCRVVRGGKAKPVPRFVSQTIAEAVRE